MKPSSLPSSGDEPQSLTVLATLLCLLVIGWFTLCNFLYSLAFTAPIESYRLREINKEIQFVLLMSLWGIPWASVWLAKRCHPAMTSRGRYWFLLSVGLTGAALWFGWGRLVFYLVLLALWARATLRQDVDLRTSSFQWVYASLLLAILCGGLLFLTHERAFFTRIELDGDGPRLSAVSEVLLAQLAHLGS